MRADRIALAVLPLCLLPLSASSAQSLRTQTASAGNSTEGTCQDALKRYPPGNYKFLLYDAALGQTHWANAAHDGNSDAVRHKNIPHTATKDEDADIAQATTKDEIVVVVCRLKFDMSVNVTANSVGIPERGLDVRGIAPAVTPSAPASSTDALQTAIATTSSALAAVIAPATNSSTLTANSIVTPGSFDQDGKYSPAKLSATPEDVRNALILYNRQAEALQKQILALTANTDAQSPNGICKNVRDFQDELQQQVEHGAKDNIGAFDQAKARVFQLSTRLAALNSEIAALMPGTRAATLATSYNSIRSGLMTLDRIRQQDEASNAKASLQAEDRALLQFLQELKPYALDGQKRIVDANGDLIQPEEIYAKLGTLKETLLKIDAHLRQSFQLLDEWREASSVTYADTLTPGTSNQIIRIGISVSDNYTPFTLSYSSSSAAAPAGSASHYVSTTEVFVERRTYFNFTGGFLAIHIPTQSYTLVESTVPTPAAGSSFSPCNSASTVTVSTSGTIPTYYCPVINQKTPWQVGGIAAITYFPFGRNYFPRRLQIGHAPSSSIAKDLASDFGLMLGTSVTQLGSGFGGVSFEPLYGLNFYAGIASANSTRLAAGGGSNHDIYTTSTAPTIQNLHVGLSLGIGFDFNVFTNIFKNGAVGPSIP